MADLEAKDDGSWLQLQYIKHATDELVASRVVLKYTYVKAFFMEDGCPEKNLFEHMQKLLEMTTEHLSLLLEDEIGDVGNRLRVIDAASKATQVRQNLLSAVEAGILPVCAAQGE
mmetsp:Transcript_50098/g.108849  ORF Transcript_50098/g.108849 Transcript_50098/m.108849 type:complete len:115 (+) Transcript_50098:1131-1475(+)